MSKQSAEIPFAPDECVELEWDIYGQVTTQLEAELGVGSLSVNATWDTPLNFTVYEGMKIY